MLFLVSGINITNKIADIIEKNPNIINGKGYQYNSPFKFYLTNKSVDYIRLFKRISNLKKKLPLIEYLVQLWHPYVQTLDIKKQLNF